MIQNPVLAMTLEVLADAQSLMGNALSMTWDATKSQESYLSRGPSWQGYDVPSQLLFDKASRLQLMELGPVLSHEFHQALQRRMLSSLSLVRSDAPSSPAPSARPPSPSEWRLEGELQLSSDVELIRKVRTGRIVNVVESVCAAELEVMVGLQIECLRHHKATQNPFSAFNFSAALMQALERAIPDDKQQQAFLQVLVPSFAQALQYALRFYAKSLSRKLAALAPPPVPRASRRATWDMDQQYEPTVPSAL